MLYQSMSLKFNFYFYYLILSRKIEKPNQFTNKRMQTQQ